MTSKNIQMLSWRIIVRAVYRSRFAALHAQRSELKASVTNALSGICSFQTMRDGH
jgi:hypothetical protein